MGCSKNQSATKGHDKDKNCAAPLKFKNFPCTQVCNVARKYGLAGTTFSTKRLINKVSTAPIRRHLGLYARVTNTQIGMRKP